MSPFWNRRLINSFVPESEKKLILWLDRRLHSLSSFIDRYDFAAHLMAETKTTLGVIFDERIDLSKRLAAQSIEMDDYQVQTKPLDHAGHFNDLLQHMAARDNAMTAWHFGVVTKSIVRQAGRAPVVFSYVDRDKLSQVNGMFEAAFPQAGSQRNAVAHESQIGDSPETEERHKIDGPVELPGVAIGENASGFSASGLLAGDVLANTWKPDKRSARLVSSHVDSTPLEQLLRIEEILFEAFSPAIEATKQANRDRRTLEPRAQPPADQSGHQ